MVRYARWHVLSRLIRRNGLKLGVEVGADRGRLSRNLLNHCQNLRLTAVDYWPEGYYGRSAEDQADARAEFIGVLESYKRLRLIEKPSLDAAEDFENESLDFVFIDADHSYEGCRDDIRAWSPKVRHGGFILGHDYNPERFHGVVQAVKEEFPIYWLIGAHCWSVMKGFCPPILGDKKKETSTRALSEPSSKITA